MLATTIHKSNTTPHHQDGATENPAPRRGPCDTPGFPPSGRRGDGPAVSKPNSVSGGHPRNRDSLFVAHQNHTHYRCGPSNESVRDRRIRALRAGPNLVVLLRKEVIQPHLPVRLPCYDFVPIADPTFDGSLPQGVRPPASGVTDFHDVTGGVYKARERIHRSVADLRLLATPTSRGRVADPDPN